ncbi:hypothetical protein M408DRAFT_266407 [Serendipita vermifera MAFF 305830]|uniref:Uncharacterized protein n=1 Tax=Serendipita vermifera MAFF 305830 TaxID=933852 RepID=A0A0C2W9R7_SERVB|nr:hypothetical protein M408DRAFT_266407 [Serendipita vermifera MAFF 305830]
MVLPQTGPTSSGDVSALFIALAYSPVSTWFFCTKSLDVYAHHLPSHSQDPGTQPKQHPSMLAITSRHPITFWITSRIAGERTVRLRRPTTARSSLSTTGA